MGSTTIEGPETGAILGGRVAFTYVIRRKRRIRTAPAPATAIGAWAHPLDARLDGGPVAMDSGYGAEASTSLSVSSSKQATWCRDPTDRTGMSPVRQSSMVYGHRGAKGQPWRSTLRSGAASEA